MHKNNNLIKTVYFNLILTFNSKINFKKLKNQKKKYLIIIEFKIIY